MLTIKIKTDNQAFVDDFSNEIFQCLYNINKQSNMNNKEGNIHDSYGNVCGSFKLTK